MGSKNTPVPELDRNDWYQDIVCPACGMRDYEHSDYPASLRHDGDATETECSGCGAAFHVEMCVEYTFRTRTVTTSETR